MKLSLSILALCIVVFTGCGDEKSPGNSTSSEITVEDLLWATDWKIYKWKIRDLTDADLREIQIVVVGPAGQVVQEGVSVGYDSVLDPEMEITLGLKKVGADVHVKLRGGGTVSSKMEDVFAGNSFAFGPKNDVHNGLLVIATDSSSSMMSSQAELDKPCNKICLRLWPFKPEEKVDGRR